MAPSGTVSSGTDYTFSGKEKQRFGAVHDFGARMYDPRNAIWNAIDPKAEKYYSVTPHAYCNNNPVIFVDPGGEAIETAWDVMNVVSDAVSLVSNVANGNTVGAIVDAGALVIDAVAAVVPFLPGGAGTAVNAARRVNHAQDAKSIAKGGLGISSNFTQHGKGELNTAKSSGSYTIEFKSGKKYHGRGLENRMKQSAAEKSTKYGDEVVSMEWTPAPSNRQAFIDEAIRIEKDGGVNNSMNYNLINSPGKKYMNQ